MEAAVRKMVNHSATPRQVPAAVPLRSVPTGTVQLQTALHVSSPRDPAEREAESTARKIMRMPVPEGVVATGAGNAPHRALPSPYIARFADSIRLMRRHTGQREAGANVAAELSRSQGSGAPLPTGVRNFMEPRFRADFGQVRIHTGDQAARLNRQVAARAFTVGNQIYFGRNQYQPETSEGRELIAHELTHTIQQGAAKQRGEAKQQAAPKPRPAPKPQGAVTQPSAAVQQGKPLQRSEDVTVVEEAPQRGTPLQLLEDVTVAEQSPPQVQRLGMSDVLDFFADTAKGYGVNPLTMSPVHRSMAKLLLVNLEDVWNGAKPIFTKPIDLIIAFVKGLADADPDLIKMEKELTKVAKAVKVVATSINEASRKVPTGQRAFGPFKFGGDKAPIVRGANTPLTRNFGVVGALASAVQLPGKLPTAAKDAIAAFNDPGKQNIDKVIGSIALVVRTVISTAKDTLTAAGNIQNYRNVYNAAMQAAKDVPEAVARAVSKAVAQVAINASEAGKQAVRGLGLQAAKAAAAAERAVNPAYMRVPRPLCRKIAREAGKRAASAAHAAAKVAGPIAKAAGRFTPVANIAIAALDIANAYSIFNDKDASAWKKGAAGITALGSIAAATNIWIVAQVGAVLSTVSSLLSSFL